MFHVVLKHCDTDESKENKRGRGQTEIQMSETAGVLEHPCRAQWGYYHGTAKGLGTLGQFVASTN